MEKPTQFADEKSNETTSGSGRKESCIKHFDAIWFCYCELQLHATFRNQCIFPPVLLSLLHSLVHPSRLRLTEAALHAAPVHQTQEYYRYGQVDDCMGHWSKLWACLKQRTKFAEEVKPTLFGLPAAASQKRKFPCLVCKTIQMYGRAEHCMEQSSDQ